MKTSLEKLSSIKQCLTVEVPSSVVDAAEKVVLEKIRAEAKVPGFRKGKVPDNLLRKYYSQDIEVETVREVVRKSYPAAVAESSAMPLAEPYIEPIGKMLAGADFKYKATFEVYPDVKAAGYDKLALERDVVEVADKEVEAELTQLQRQMTQLEPVEDGVLGEGMVGMIDFKGMADGNPFPGSEAENYVVEFGTGTLLKDFEVQIEGMKAMEERNISFHYPKDYFNKEVAGKKGEFKVKVKEVRKKITPELTDDFAKELGAFKNLKEVKEDVKKRIMEHKEQSSRNILKEQVIRKLIDAHKKIEVPDALIDAELGNMLEQLERQLKTRGQTLESAKIDTKEFVEANVAEAADRARGYMVISAIAKQEGVNLSDEEVDKKIKELASLNRQPTDKVREHFEKNNLLGQLKSQLIFEKTLDFVLAKAKIKEKKAKKEKKK